MQTIKEVLGREDERRNLKHVAICFLTVTTLVMGSFGLTTLSSLFENGRGVSSENAVVITEILE